MSAAPSYRVVQFVASPPRSPPVSIAALLREKGHVRVALAQRLPDPERLGERSAATLLQILEGLRRTESFDRLPASLGPHAKLAPPLELPPQGQTDPVLWLQQHVLVPPPSLGVGTLRRPLRSQRGTRFFETYGVSDKVRLTFWPSVNLPDWPAHVSSALPVVGQYAVLKDPTEYCLLEAIAQEEDVGESVDNLRAYQVARSSLQGGEVSVRLIAFLLPSGSTTEQRRKQQQLQRFTDATLDMDQRQDREQLLSLLRERGVVEPTTR